MIDTRWGEKNARILALPWTGNQTLTPYSLAGSCDWASWPLGFMENPEVKTLSEVAMEDSSPLQNASYARRNLA